MTDPSGAGGAGIVSLWTNQVQDVRVCSCDEENRSDAGKGGFVTVGVGVGLEYAVETLLLFAPLPRERVQSAKQRLLSRPGFIYLHREPMV
eukprot:1180778-Prorocentrum_minimum.AAC.2